MSYTETEDACYYCGTPDEDGEFEWYDIQHGMTAEESANTDNLPESPTFKLVCPDCAKNKDIVPS